MGPQYCTMSDKFLQQIHLCGSAQMLSTNLYLTEILLNSLASEICGSNITFLCFKFIL